MVMPTTVRVIVCLRPILSRDGHSGEGFLRRKYNLSASFPSKNAPTITPAMKADIVPSAIDDLLDIISSHLNFKS